MNYEFLDKQGLTKVINWIKNTFGRIKTINGKSPDENGDVIVDKGNGVLASMIGNDGSMYEITNKSFNKNLVQSMAPKHIQSLNSHRKIGITDVLRFGYKVMFGELMYDGYSPFNKHLCSATAILEGDSHIGTNNIRCILISPLKIDDFIVCLNNPDKLIDSFDLSSNGDNITSTPTKIESQDYGYWIYNGGVSDYSDTSNSKVFTDFWFKKDVNGNISNSLVLYNNKWHVINNKSFPVEPMNLDLKGELHFIINTEEFLPRLSYCYNSEKFVMSRGGLELYDLSSVDEDNYNQVSPVFTFADDYRGIKEVFLDGDRVVVFVDHDTGMQVVLMNSDYSGFSVINDIPLIYVDCKNGIIESVALNHSLITYNYDSVTKSYVKNNTIESTNLLSGIGFKSIVIYDDNVLYSSNNATVYRKNNNTIEVYNEYDDPIVSTEPIFRVGDSACYITYSKHPVTSVNGVKAFNGNVNLEYNIKQIATELDEKIEIGSVNYLNNYNDFSKWEKSGDVTVEGGVLYFGNAGDSIYQNITTKGLSKSNKTLSIICPNIEFKFKVVVEKKLSSGDFLVLVTQESDDFGDIDLIHFSTYPDEEYRISIISVEGDPLDITSIQLEEGDKATSHRPSEADRVHQVDLKMQEAKAHAKALDDAMEIGCVNLLNDTEFEKLSNLSVVIYDIANPSEITLGNYMFIADIHGQIEECFVDVYFRDDIGVIGSISQPYKSGGIIEFNLEIENLPRQPKYIYIRSSKYVSGNTDSFNINVKKAILVKGTKFLGWQPSEDDRKARLNQLSSWNVLKDSAQILLQGSGTNVNKTFEIADLPYNAFIEKDKFTIGCHIDTKTYDGSVVEGTVKIILNYMKTTGVPQEASHTFDIKGYSGKLFKVIDTPECAFLMDYTIQTSLSGNFNIYLPFAVIGEYMAGYLPSYSEIINPPTPSVFMMSIGDNTLPTLNVPTDTFTPLKALSYLFKKGVDFEETSDGTNDLKVKYVGTEEVAIEVIFHGEVSLHDTSLNPISEPFFTIFKDNEQGRVDYIQRYNYETNNIVQNSFILKCQPNSILSFRVKSSYAIGNCIVKHGDLIFKVL